MPDVDSPTLAYELHAHLLPAKRNASLMRWMHHGYDCAIPVDITTDEALQSLRDAGAQQIVNLLFPLKPGEADELHAWGAEYSRVNPDVIPVAGVHAADEDPAAVVQRALGDHGMRGLKLHPMVQRFTPGDPRLAGALSVLDDAGLPMYVHTGFDEWYGWGYDTGELEQVAARYPNIKLVLCHANWPRLDWAIDMAERFEQVWLDTTNAWWASLNEPTERHAWFRSQFERMFSVAGDRVFFGTDHPATPDWPLKLHPCVGQLLPDFDAARVMADNAPRFLQLFKTSA